MDYQGYTHTSSSMNQGPATSTQTNTKKRLGESEFPKMLNVEQRSEKKTNLMEQFQQFQKRIKQMKRKITKNLEKFSRNIEQRYPGDDDEMDQTGSVQIILKEQENIRDRFRKMENEIEKLHLPLT